MYDCLPTDFLKSTDRCIVSDQQHAIVFNEAPYHMVPTKVADVSDWMASKTGRVFGFLKTQMESARPARLHKAAGTPQRATGQITRAAGHSRDRGRHLQMGTGQDSREKSGVFHSQRVLGHFRVSISIGFSLQNAIIGIWAKLLRRRL